MIDYNLQILRNDMIALIADLYNHKDGFKRFVINGRLIKIDYKSGSKYHYGFNLKGYPPKEPKPDTQVRTAPPPPRCRTERFGFDIDFSFLKFWNWGIFGMPYDTPQKDD